MRNDHSQNFNKLLPICVIVVAFTTSSCATLFVRSESTAKPKHIYPATTSDAKFFWNCSVKGEPPITLADPEVRTQPLIRVGYGVAAVIDLPFSMVSDTVILPVDLYRSFKPTETLDAEDEKIDSSESDHL